ncbi:MAG: antitoxin Xre/MbcA/ParS toxin-binding domain-containing protein [Myxococcota bacterium]
MGSEKNPPSDAREVYKSLGIITSGRTDLVKTIRSGIRINAVYKTADAAGTSVAALGRIVGLPSTTLSRRKGTTGKLSPDESDRLYRVASIYKDALHLFEGSKPMTQRWMNAPAVALGGSTPLEYLDTEAGAERVRELIWQLESGVVI